MKEEKKSYVSYAIECLKDLYRKTDKDGYFYIQGCDFYGDGGEEEYECVTSFTKKEFRDSLFGISMDVNAIEAIVEMQRNDEFFEETLRDEPELKETYDRLLEPFDIEISDEMLEKITFYDEDELTEDERKTRDAYYEERNKLSIERVGKGLSPSNYITRAQRVAKLLVLGTPYIIVKNEIRCFVIAYVLFHYGKSLTRFEEGTYDDTSYYNNTFNFVSNSSNYMSNMTCKLKCRREIDQMTLEEKDAYTDTLDDIAWKKTFERQRNKLESLTPLFIYFILKNHKGQKMSQKAIREELYNCYGVEIGEKALGRIINTMTPDEANYGIRYYQNVGAYYVGEENSED